MAAGDQVSLTNVPVLVAIMNFSKLILKYIELELFVRFDKDLNYLILLGRS